MSLFAEGCLISQGAAGQSQSLLLSLQVWCYPCCPMLLSIAVVHIKQMVHCCCPLLIVCFYPCWPCSLLLQCLAPALWVTWAAQRSRQLKNL